MSCSFTQVSHSVYGVKRTQGRVICSDGVILRRNCSSQRDGQWRCGPLVHFHRDVRKSVLTVRQITGGLE